MAQLIAFQGATQAESYQITSPRKVSRKQAEPRASNICARPDLAARLAYLRSQARQAKPPPPDRKTPAPAPTETEQPAPLTLAEARDRITHAVRTAATSAEIAAALKIARELLRLDEQDSARPPDPAAVIAYAAQCAGRAPRQIAADLGGLRWMLERVAEYARAPASELRRALRAWLRDLDRTPEGPECLNNDASPTMGSVSQDDTPTPADRMPDANPLESV
jgi:hypothetical protein